MSGLRYFALKRLPVYDLDGEPLTLEPGDLVPEELIEEWGDRGVHPAVSMGRIAPIPAALAALMESERPKARSRAKVAA